MLKIEFVSDVSCPWCVIGLKSLEQALSQLPQLEARIHFQPFELNPGMPAEGEEINAHLARKYGASPAQLEQTREQIRQRGEALGFSFTKGARDRIYNTFDAHRLLHWAGDTDLQKQKALKLALFSAYFTEGRNPGAREVLLAAVDSVGLDRSAAEAVLDSQAHAEAVREREAFWHAQGIHSVPSLVINERYLLQGGQAPEVFAQALRQIAAEEDKAGTGTGTGH